jgi:hypothetical protein
LSTRPFFLALEVQDGLLSVADLFALDVCHGDADFAAAEVGCLEIFAWKFFGDFHVI